MTDHLLLQAFQIVTLDALEQHRVKLTMLGEQLQTDHQTLIRQSTLSWLGYPHWLEANLEAVQELTADVQQLLQLGEAFLDLEQWLTSGFAPGINPFCEPSSSDRPFPKRGIVEQGANQVQPSGEREMRRSPYLQASAPLKADPIGTLVEETASPRSPDSVLPIHSAESVTLPLQNQLRFSPIENATASDSEPTRFSTPTAFSRIGEHFTAAQSDSDLSNLGRLDLQEAAHFPTNQGELEDKTRSEQAGLAQSDLFWTGALSHSSPRSSQSQAEVLLTSETEMQISQSFKGLRDFAQMIETSAGMAIAPNPAAVNDQQSMMVNQPVTLDRGEGDPEVRIPSRGRRVGGERKRVAQSALLPEITASHDLDSAQVPPEQLAAASASVPSFQPAKGEGQTVRDLQPERSELERSEPEIQTLRLSEQDLDMILEAIAQEVQQEYRQFYGS